MSRTLHWALLTGCAALISMFTPLAWNSLQVFRLPDGPALFGGAEGQAAVEATDLEEFAAIEVADERQFEQGRR